MVELPSAGRRGSALVLVLWCIILIGLAVVGVVGLLELSLENTIRAGKEMEAHALAMTGLAFGAEPLLLKNDPVLSREPASGRSFSVTFESEGSRLNLNFILQSGHREILVNLFKRWGLDLAAADHVADCLYDWITPGNIPSMHGAKADNYAEAGLSQRPSGLPFVSLDEVAQVMGMDEVRKTNPNWRNSFTLWSNGPLDITEAPADLIAAVFSLDPDRVESFVSTRNGGDGIAGTADDVPVQNLLVFQGELGISDLQMQALGGQIELTDPYRRVRSTGRVGGVQVTISTVTKLKSSPVQYLVWLER